MGYVNVKALEERARRLLEDSPPRMKRLGDMSPDDVIALRDLLERDVPEVVGELSRLHQLERDVRNFLRVLPPSGGKADDLRLLVVADLSGPR